MNTAFIQNSASLELSCPYPDYLPVSKQQELLSNLAKEFQVISPPSAHTTHKENGSITSLLHESTNGTLSLEYISLQESWNTSDYLRIRLLLPTSASLPAFSSLLEETKIKYGLTGTICTRIEGTYPCELSFSQREKAAHSLLNTLNATPIQSIQTENTDTFYGYSQSIDSHIYSNQNYINITIAFADGPSHTTTCYIATPILLEDY